MAADSKLAVELTGDNAGLMAALAKATQGITDFAKKGEKDVDQFSHSFEKIGGALSGLKSALAGLAVVEFMRESINATIEMGAEIRRLSLYFSVSAEQAGELAEGLKRMGSSPEDFISMSAKMVKAIGKNREEFEKYGVAVTQAGKDGQPELRKQVDIMLDAGGALNKIDGDTERTAASIKMFGRSGQEAATFFRKLAYETENSKANMIAMGVEIPYDKLASEGKKAQKAQKDLTQTFDVMKIMVGTELLPSFVDLMQFFSGTAGPAIKGMSAIVQGLTGAFHALKAGIEIAVSYVTDFFLKGLAGIKGIGAALDRLLHFDVKGAIQEARDANAEIIRIDKESASIREQISEDFWKKQDSIFNKPHGKDAPESGGGGGKDDHKDKDAALARVQAALEEKKALYEMAGIYELNEHGKIIGKKAEADQENRSYTKAMEAAFLEEALKHFDGTEKEKQQLTKMTFEATRAVLAQEWKGKLATFDAEIKLETQSMAHAIQVAEAKAAAILKFEGGNAKAAEYVKADAEIKALEKKRDDMLRDVAQTRAELARDSQIAVEDARIKAIHFGIEMGSIEEAQGLKKVQAIEDRRYSIAHEALLKRIALKKLEGDAGLKEATKLEADLAKLNQQAAAKRVDTENKTTANIRAGWQTLFSGIKSGLNQSIQGMILGTTNLKSALLNVWGSLKSAFAAMVANQLMVWTGMETSKTAVTQAGAVERVAIEAWAAIKKAVIYVADGIKYIAIQAWKAAASAYNSIAAIPVVGPFIAPAAAIAALFAVMGMVKQIASARRGFDIAAGENPMTQLHEKEMVLPSEHADTIRGMRGIVAAIAKSQGRVDRYNGNNAPQATSNQRTTNTQGHTFNISGVIGDKRALGSYLKNVINQHTLTFGSAI